MKYDWDKLDLRWMNPAERERAIAETPADDEVYLYKQLTSPKARRRAELEYRLYRLAAANYLDEVSMDQPYEDLVGLVNCLTSTRFFWLYEADDVDPMDFVYFDKDGHLQNLPYLFAEIYEGEPGEYQQKD